MSMKKIILVSQALVLSTAVLAFTPSASASSVEDQYAGKWSKVPASKAGQVRVEAKCPKGMKVYGAGIEFVDLNGTSLILPDRVKKVTQGETANGTKSFAKAKVVKGDPLKIRAIAYCQ